MLRSERLLHDPQVVFELAQAIVSLFIEIICIEVSITEIGKRRVAVEVVAIWYLSREQLL